MSSYRPVGALVCAVMMFASVASASVQINLNNPSFELPDLPWTAPIADNAIIADPQITDWNELDLPAFLGLTPEQNTQAHGVFVNAPGIGLVDNVPVGEQMAFIFTLAPDALFGASIAISQVSSDTFVQGKQYDVSVLMGKSSNTLSVDGFGVTPPDSAELTVRLFYGSVANALDDNFLVDSWSVTAADLEINHLKSPDNLVPGGWVTDPVTGNAVGQPIGISFTVTQGVTLEDNTSTFNFDEVSIEQIPEPTTAALLALGGFVLAQRRRRSRVA